MGMRVDQVSVVANRIIMMYGSVYLKLLSCDWSKPLKENKPPFLSPHCKSRKLVSVFPATCQVHQLAGGWGYKYWDETSYFNSDEFLFIKTTTQFRLRLHAGNRTNLRPIENSQPRSQSSSAISDVTSPVKLVGKIRRSRLVPSLPL